MGIKGDRRSLCESVETIKILLQNKKIEKYRGQTLVASYEKKLC